MLREEGFGKINQELSKPLIEEAAKKLKLNLKKPLNLSPIINAKNNDF